MDYLDSLNKEQYEAVTRVDGYNFILAGAGTGKTHTIISKVAYMLGQGADPASILLLTFTNKAAQEMKDRISVMIGPKGLDITACTFHSFCAMFLRKHADLIGYDRNYTIIDSGDSEDAFKMVKERFLAREKAEGREYDLKDFPSVRTIAQVYEGAISQCVSFEQMLGVVRDADVYAREILQIIRDYTEYKKEKNLMDYEDLLFYTQKLLANDEELRHKTDMYYKYIFCDEYQDTNTIQNSILELLSRDEKNLTVVGDDNQSIYAFRYANIKNILGFEARYPSCRTVILDTNYRSSQEILDFANMMMTYATEGKEKYLKGLFHGDRPVIKVVEDSYEEASYIIDMINELPYALKNMAVICRSSAQSYILEAKLNQYGIPFNKFGGLKFMEKTVIKDILAFLRISINMKDEIALFRILQLYPGIGKTYAQKIAKMTAEDGLDAAKEKYRKKAFFQYIEEMDEAVKKMDEMSLNEKLHFLIDDYYRFASERRIQMMNTSEGKKSEYYSDLSSGLEDAETLYSLAEKYRSTSRFLADIALEATNKDADGDKLNITTIHSAKGLEYDAVFIMDCIEGVTPSCGEDDEENAEELRCMYVAATRARKNLFLIMNRYYNMRKMKGYLSHFINKQDILETCDIDGYLGRNLQKPRYDFYGWDI